MISAGESRVDVAGYRRIMRDSPGRLQCLEVYKNVRSQEFSYGIVRFQSSDPFTLCFRPNPG
jgi:hypothetical protein